MLSVSGCSCFVETPDKSVEAVLYRNIDHHREMERYKACLLLGELVLSDRLLWEIREKIGANESADLCRRYLLAKRSGKPSDITAYVEAFPIGRRQQWIWETHFSAGFPVDFSSPYFAVLSDQAMYAKNDRALETLVSGLPYADGSAAETLVGLLADMYSAHPDRVMRALDKTRISKQIKDLIVATSQ